MSTVKGDDISCVHVSRLGEEYNYTASDCTHGLPQSERTLAYWRERLPNQPATWEGSVLPALRAQAVATLPDDVGYHVVKATDASFTVEARRPGSWATSKIIRRGSAEHMLEDVEALALYAEGAERNFRRNAVIKPTDCPVCQAPAKPWQPQVGDRVLLPRLAEVDGTPGFVPSMRDLCGREGVVDGINGNRMSVRVNGGYAWLWPTALLRPA